MINQFIYYNYRDFEEALDNQIQSDIKNTGRLFMRGVPDSFYFTRNTCDGLDRLLYCKSGTPVYGFKRKVIQNVKY